MFLERLRLTNFQCFGPGPSTIHFDPRLTALLGANATGKTAACQALLRLFSVVTEQRQVQVEDFHVPDDQDNAPDYRELTIEAVFSFPELAAEVGDANGAADGSAEAGAPGAADGAGAAGAAGAGDPAGTVPEFFAQMTADDNGELKLRIVLQASWSADGSVTGTIEESRRIVHTFVRPPLDCGVGWGGCPRVCCRWQNSIMTRPEDTAGDELTLRKLLRS